VDVLLLLSPFFAGGRSLQLDEFPFLFCSFTLGTMGYATSGQVDADGLFDRLNIPFPSLALSVILVHWYFCS
jgi:hypothetical protein